MKRVILALLALLFAQGAMADVQVISRKRNDATHVCWPMKTTSTGKAIAALADITCTVSLQTEGSAPGSFATTGDTTESEVATSSGVYCVDLTAGETNADYIWLKCTSATAGIEDQWIHIVTHLEVGDVSVVSGTTNIPGLTITGNGTAPGALISGGRNGMRVVAGANGYAAAQFEGLTTGAGINLVPGATGPGLQIAGGATSGNGIDVTTTDGHALNLLAAGSAKNAMLATSGSNAVFFNTAAGSALKLQTTLAGATIPALSIINGASGLGISVVSPLEGLKIVSSGSSDAVTITASAGNGDAIQLNPNGTGSGISCGAAVCLSSTSSVISNRRE